MLLLIDCVYKSWFVIPFCLTRVPVCHSPQLLTSPQPWTQRIKKLYLPRYTHPLTLWHSHSAMCEYNACLLFLTNTGFYYFLCCCQESWADFRAQDSNLLVLWSYNCLCHVFWIAGLDFVLCFWCKYYLSELLCYWIDCIFDHRRLHASLLNWILTYMYICTQLYIPLEFLTSLWEMWTAAQGWGSPRKTEAGWDTIFLFPACTVSIYLF